MNRLQRLLASIVLLALTQFGAISHAGITTAYIQIDLSVSTAPTPPVQPVVAGTFAYGVSCTATTGATFNFPSTPNNIVVNAATPTTGTITTYAGNSVSSGNTCTVTQLSRPAAPSGYAWAAAPANVAFTNMLSTGMPPPRNAAFSNVLIPLFTVTGVASPVGSGTISCDSPIAGGSTSTCTATANSGFHLGGFSTSSCGAASTTSPFVTNAITANCTVTATFLPDTVPVTTVANLPGGGSVSCVPNPVTLGNSATCTATAYSGYILTGISGCGASSSQSPMVTAALTAPCTVTAQFAVFVLPPSVPVPTLDAWMLLALALFIGAMALGLRARRA